MKIILATLIFLLYFNYSLASQISSIEITGNKRISSETIRVLGDIDVNQGFNNDFYNQTLKKLYDTEFFQDIKINYENNILKIFVVENPIIDEIRITGIKKDDLKDKLLEIISLKNRSSFIDYKLQNDLSLLKDFLSQNGYYFSEINVSRIDDQSNNSVILNLNVSLGKKAKIRKISFIGDKKFKEKKLKSLIASEESKFWKFISNKVYLDQRRIELDKRLLLNYYKNNGFYNAIIDDSFVEFTLEGDFNLIYNIQAGEKFRFNNISLNLPVDFNKDDFNKIFEIAENSKNRYFSLNTIEDILDEIDQIAILKNYEFLNADVEERIVGVDKLDFIINFKQSEKYYVNRINVIGNQFTLEEVIRNSLIVDEGDPFNNILFNKSINALKSKNIFKSVNYEINNNEIDNTKDITIKVEEKPTGEISLGAGVGTSGGSIGAGIRENNFLGKNINLDTNLEIDENRITGQFIYSKPNFNYSDNSLFLSAKSSVSDFISDYGYKTSENSLGIGTKFEQFNNLFFSPSILMSYEELETTASATNNLKKQTGDYLDLYFNYNLDYDRRNQIFQPSKGFRTGFSQEIPFLSENNELINTFTYTRYNELVNDMVGKFGFYAKTANSLTDDDVRISKRLNVPYNRLRGFQKGKIGPKENESYIGGNYVSALNYSVTLPQILPTLENADFSAFIDTANVWGVDYDSSLDNNSKIRSSTGIAVDLLTPIGPLNFSLSETITKVSSDKTETFRFNIGTSF
jgi:outer membrane protein insertion porin family